jgi:hypothetical protein
MQNQAGPQHVVFLQERRRFRARVCLISFGTFLQFTQECTVNFENEGKRGIFLLLSRELCSKTNNWSCEIPAREPAGPPEPCGKAQIGCYVPENFCAPPKRRRRVANRARIRVHNVPKYLNHRTECRMDDSAGAIRTGSDGRLTPKINWNLCAAAEQKHDLLAE